MRLILILLLLVIVSPAIVTAQKEKNIWYFGEYAGLDFNSGAPVVLNDGNMISSEGCASIADPITGKLLFYTNGIFVWNRNHQIMPNGNGLHGHVSSTQSALIVPMPGNSSRYYIFTTDALESITRHGLSYYIVDMTRDGGLGDVITPSSAQLMSYAAEKLTAVRICDYRYWILARGAYSDFYVYTVTDTGISIPVISQAGISIGSLDDKDGSVGIGYMKMSPDGSKLAVANYEYGVVEVFDFDIVNGRVTNPVTIVAPIPSQTPGSQRGTYGLSFSPDNTKLYVSVYQLYPFSTTTKLLQFDVTRHDSISIAASRVVLPSSSSMLYATSLQLAPDGKIYVSMIQNHFLGVIDYPNVAGTGCMFRENAVDLGTSTANFGLPNMIDADAVSGATTIDAGSDVVICPGESTRLMATGTANFQWSPATGLSCTDCADPIARPLVSTVYTVSSLDINGCVEKDSVRVEVVQRTQVVHGYIGRSYRISPGASLQIPVVLTERITASGLDTIELDVHYGSGILRLTGIDPAGGLLDGWYSEPLIEVPGHYQVRMIAPTGIPTLDTGTLITLEMQAFLGDSLGSELPVNVTLVGSECQRVEITPGRVALDSICGLGYRLIEMGALKYALEQNDPNPFNPTTRIAFSLAFDGAVRLDVFNARGEQVAVLVDAVLAAGSYESVWDGSDVPSGLYYYRLTTDGWSATRQMVLVK